jgi:hypothetical protein
MIKTKRTRWTRLIACMEEDKHIQIFGTKIEERDHKEDLDVDGKIIIKLILESKDVRARTKFIWLRIGTSGRLL